MRKIILFSLITAGMICPSVAYAAHAPVGLAASVSVQTAGQHTCSLSRAGKVSCWGGEADLFCVSISCSYHFMTMLPPAHTPAIRQFSTSRNQSCAVLKNHRLVCWGGDADGSETSPDWPTHARQVVSANGGSCAIRMDRKVACWSVWLRLGPTVLDPPSDLGPVKQLAASLQADGKTSSWCAIKADGLLRCWTTPETNEPANHVPSGLGPVRQVSVSRQTICAVQRNWQVVCWNNLHAYRPKIPKSLGRPMKLRTGKTNCLLGSSGRIHCWGSGLGLNHKTLGRLGKIKDLGDLNQLHRCLLNRRGKVYCWGNDWSGQVSGAPGQIVLQANTLFDMGDDICYKDDYTPDSCLSSGNIYWSNQAKVRDRVEYSPTGIQGWKTSKVNTNYLSDFRKYYYGNYIRYCSYASNPNGKRVICSRPFFLD